jgi:hypothetical protein
MKIEWKLTGTNNNFQIVADCSNFVLTNTFHVDLFEDNYYKHRYMGFYKNTPLEKFIKRYRKLERL